MLAVAGGKGGCGKTTTTLGLARAVQGPALAVDTDREMPNLHTLARVDRSPTLAALGDRPVEAVARPTEGGVRVVTAPVRSGPGPGGQSDTPGRGIDGATATGLGRLRRTTATDKSVPDAVLVDTPAGSGPDAVTPLRLADAVLLVSTVGRQALEDTAKTAAMARTLDTPPLGLVLTGTPRVPEGVADFLSVSRVWPVPDVDDPLSTRTVLRTYERIAEALPMDGATSRRGVTTDVGASVPSRPIRR